MNGCLLDRYLKEVLPCKEVLPSKRLFNFSFSHTVLQSKSTSAQHGLVCNTGPSRCFFSTRVKACSKFHGTLRGPYLDGRPVLGGVYFHLGLQTLKMSGFTSDSHFSTLGITETFSEQKDGEPSVDVVRRLVFNETNGGADSAEITIGQSRPSRRQFCTRCSKAASLCICHHVKTLVNNLTTITILQHPQEKKHHLGSARIAALGLENVELISIPEVDEQVSCRMRAKVPGSKRFLARRGGKKAQYLEISVKNKKTSSKCPCVAKCPGGTKLQPSHSIDPQSKQDLTSQTSGNGHSTSSEFDATLGVEDAVEISGEDQRCIFPPWIKVQPDAGLLFPSEHALDLWPSGLKLMSSSDSTLAFHSDPGKLTREGTNKSLTQLIVLDGTWSKAKRILFQNPWLHSLPHYRLPTLQESRYGSLRPEPKPGFLSTVESIVYALQLLEPETQDLDSLIHAFDSMIMDQRRCIADKSRVKKY